MNLFKQVIVLNFIQLLRAYKFKIKPMQQHLTSLLNTKINPKLSLAHNLDLLDSIVKQLSISPTSHQALTAYQQVCQHYLHSYSRSPPNKRLASPSPPRFGEVDDPEQLAHFSFAKQKNNNLTKKGPEIRPERLFKQSTEEDELKKGRSEDVMPIKNAYKMPNKHYVSSFQLPTSLNESLSSNCVEDLKTMSRVRLQELENKQEQFMNIRKGKLFKEFLDLIFLEQKTIRWQLKKKSADFSRKTVLLNHSFTTFKDNIVKAQLQQRKAIDFRNQRDQVMLQQYFLGWKQRAMMTQLQRAFEEQVHQKYELMCKIRLVRSLQINRNINQMRDDRIEQYTLTLKQTLESLSKVRFLSCLKNKQQEKNDYKKQVKSLTLTLQKEGFRELSTTIAKFKIFRQQRQQNKARKLLKNIYGWKLLDNLKWDNQIKKVYWKNPDKIILLKKMFQAISDSFSRKGYNQQWMHELPQCLEITDRKLGSVARKFQLSQIFNGLKNYLQLEKQKCKAVQMIHGKSIIKQLLNNYRLSMLIQKQQYQTEKFYERVTQPKMKKYLQTFRENTNRYFYEKQLQLHQAIKASRAREAFNYLAAYRFASSYYKHKVHDFEDKIQLNFLRQVFNGFKRVTMTAVINKKIVQQFNAYRNRRQLQTIFSCMKQYSFEEKIIKNRTKLLQKMRLRSSFEVITFNMRVAMYGGYKYKHEIINNKKNLLQQKIHKRMVSTVFSSLRKRQLKKIIDQQVSREYTMRFIWKAFTALKVVIRSRKRQSQLMSIIQAKVERKAKSAVIDSMISIFLRNLSLRNCLKISLRPQMRTAFESIRQYELESSEREAIDSGSDQN